MNKKIILLTMMALILPFVSAFQLSTGDIFHLTCNNATSGELLGSAANIDCYDSANTNDVASAAMTNVATGKFRYTFSETDDYYTCYIDCPTGAVDYSIPVWQQGIEDDIASILTDTGTTLDAALAVVDSNVDSILTDTGTTLDGKIDTIDANVDAILVDTSTTLDDYLDTEIASILADTGELQTNQGNWVTATGFTTKTDINNLNESLRGYGDSNWATGSTSKTLFNSLNESLRTYGDAQWATATGFATQAQVDTECLDGTELTTATVGTCSALTTNNDKTGYGLANDAITSSIIADNAIGSTELAANSIGSSELATDGINEISNTLVPAIDTRINLSHGEGDYLTGAGGSSPTEAEIYTYFIAGSNEDQFKSDVSALSLEATLSGICYDTNLTQGITTLTTTTESQIDACDTRTNAILIDTSAQDTSSEWLGLMSDSIDNITRNITVDHGTGLYNTSGTTSADIWGYVTRTLTSSGAITSQDISDIANATANYDMSDVSNITSWAYYDKEVWQQCGLI
jgi:hypothetical protein